MSVFQVIAHNLLGFDLIIFVAAALNGVCYYFARKNADRLYRKLHMIVFVPSRRNDPDSVSKAIRDVDEEQVVAMRKRSESLYSVFVNVTAIFPLLGILGTVVSLLPMVADMADQLLRRPHLHLLGAGVRHPLQAPGRVPIRPHGGQRQGRGPAAAAAGAAHGG